MCRLLFNSVEASFWASYYHFKYPINKGYLKA